MDEEGSPGSCTMGAAVGAVFTTSAATGAPYSPVLVVAVGCVTPYSETDGRDGGADPSTGASTAVAVTGCVLPVVVAGGAEGVGGAESEGAVASESGVAGALGIEDAEERKLAMATDAWRCSGACGLINAASAAATPPRHPPSHSF